MTKEDYDLLIKAASNYYNGLDTGLTDQEYDNLFNTAKSENPDFNIFKLIKVGTDRQDVLHKIPFTPQAFKQPFSSIEEITSYINESSNQGWVVTPKYDGCSIRAYYDSGVLSDIITRSDDIQGKRKFDSLYNKVPHNVNNNVTCIDFEAVCSKEDYGDDIRSNANGLVNSCYKQDEVDKFLCLIPFKVTTKDVMKYTDAMRLVFSDDEFKIIDVSTLDYNNRFIEFKGKHYPIDGVVLYDDTVKNHKIYKHYFNNAPTSIVTNIYWNFTDKLCWVPKIQFQTVKIDGRNVSQASSNGFARLKSLKAGIGSTIEIILANSTIPQVHKVLVPSENYNEPKICPYCGSTIINVGEKLRCSNHFCSNIINWITDWYSELLCSDKRGMKSLDEIKEFINDMKKFHTQDELLSKLGESLFIERFNKLAEVSKRFVSEKDKLFNGFKSIELIGDLFTYNQHLIYETYCDLIDKIIYYIKE